MLSAVYFKVREERIIQQDLEARLQAYHLINAPPDILKNVCHLQDRAVFPLPWQLAGQSQPPLPSILDDYFQLREPHAFLDVSAKALCNHRRISTTKDGRLRMRSYPLTTTNIAFLLNVHLLESCTCEMSDVLLVPLLFVGRESLIFIRALLFRLSSNTGRGAPGASRLASR